MQSNDANHRYDDIIDLPRPTSATHPCMSQRDRAAQFSPFAALVGYDAEIRETARLTGERQVLDEAHTARLDCCLQLLIDNAASRPDIAVTYFQPDEKKAGGAYVTVAGRFKRVDEEDHTLVLADGTKIPLDAVSELESSVLALM